MFKLLTASRLIYLAPLTTVGIGIPTKLYVDKANSEREHNVQSDIYFRKVTNGSFTSKVDTKLETFMRKYADVKKYTLHIPTRLTEQFTQPNTKSIVSSQYTGVSSNDFFKNKGQQMQQTMTSAPNDQNVETVPVQSFNKNFPPGDHKFIVFGETGCGKSTFLNTSASYFGNGTLEKPNVVIPNTFYKGTEGYKHTERNIKDRTCAQTDGVTDYTFKVGKSTIIISDTPGLNDTKGTDQDDVNLNKIIDSAINSKSISGIILVINGTNARMTSNIRILLNKFRGFLPDSIMKNIVVVFTMCRQETCNFTDLSQLGIEPAKVFYMNNTAFSSDPKLWKDMTMLQHEWNQSMQECDNIFGFGTSMSAISTFEFEQMRTIRNHIKKSLHEARLKITNLAKIQSEYMTAKADADKYEATEEQFKNYTVQKTIPKTILVPHTEHSTICSKCTTVCHFECGLNEIKENDHDKTGISRCACFSGGTCNRCGCDPSTHYHSRVKEETTTVTLDEELTDIKNKFIAANKGKQDALKQMSNHDIIKAGIEKEIEDLKTSILADCNDLKKICKNYNLVTELTDLITQLEAESVLLTSVEAKQTCNDFVAALKSVVNTLTNDPSKAVASGKTPEPKKSSWFW